MAEEFYTRDPFAEDKTARPLASLFSELTQGTTQLFRKEIELARAEMSQKISQVGSGAAEIAIGGLTLFVALQALVAAAIIGLSFVLEWWLAALVVGVALAIVGGIVLARGLSNVKGENLAPRRTIESLKGNAVWARQEVREAREQMR